MMSYNPNEIQTPIDTSFTAGLLAVANESAGYGISSLANKMHINSYVNFP